MPLFILYEIGIAWIHHNSLYEVRNLVDVFIKKGIAWCGLSGFFIGSIFLLLICILIIRPKQNFLVFRFSYFFLMMFESAVLAFVFVFCTRKSGSWFLLSLSSDGVELGKGLILSAGAGIYEEFLFRVILFGSGVYVCKRVFKMSSFAAVLCAGVISSILFSLSHYWGHLSDQFTVYSFLYRFGAGFFFCVLLRLRGFAVVVYTHTLYDIFVFLNFFSWIMGCDCCFISVCLNLSLPIYPVHS